MSSIENFQTIDSIAKKRHCPESLVMQSLNLLQEMKLVVKNKDKFIHSGINIYLKREAAQVFSLHLHPRLEAVKRSQNREDIHFTNMFTISKKDLDKVKSQVLQLIETQRTTVHSSGAEVLCVFCCDFMTV